MATINLKPFKRTVEDFHHEFTEPQIRRALFIEARPLTYSQYNVIDIDSNRVYVATYNKQYVFINGRILKKCNCALSLTFKNNHFYGNGTPQWALTVLASNNPQFEWLEMYTDITWYYHIPKSSLYQIFSGKIHSGKALMRSVAKNTIGGKKGIKHFMKILEISETFGVPRQIVNAYVADIDKWEICSDKTHHFLYSDNTRDLILYGAALDIPIKLSWSDKRREEKLATFKRLWGEKEAAGYDSNAIIPRYKLEVKEGTFEMVCSERDAYQTSQHFDNCVFSRYWNRIKAGEYLCIHSESVCAGYWTTREGKLVFDQIRGKHNTLISDHKIADLLTEHVEYYYSIFKKKLEALSGHNNDIALPW